MCSSGCGPDCSTKQNRSLSGKDFEELCGMLEEKREVLVNDRRIKEKIESSANLGFYP